MKTYEEAINELTSAIVDDMVEHSAAKVHAINGMARIDGHQREKDLKGVPND